MVNIDKVLYTIALLSFLTILIAWLIFFLIMSYPGCLDAALPTEPEVSSLGRYEVQEHGSMGSDGPDESGQSGEMGHLYTHDHISANEAVSKWQLKGKRNTRSLTKRSLDATDGRSLLYGPYSEEKVSSFKFQLKVFLSVLVL